MAADQLGDGGIEQPVDAGGGIRASSFARTGTVLITSPIAEGLISNIRWNDCF